MNQSDYLNMVVMLRTATLKKKIHWEENNGDFSTKVGGCLIEIISSYDFQVGISSYSLRLYNTENVLFETISYSEDVDNENYQRLNDLYQTIRDVNYKITESEKIILDGLKKLTEPSDDGLPF